MMQQQFQHERAQSLVLVALMAIVLVAFVGLAIDGGNAYNQRRIAQNAADGGAIRGAQLVATDSWQYNDNPAIRRDDLLRRINDIVQTHGVPDTNTDPTDTINENVTAYYTDRNGNPHTACTVATCTVIPAQAYGVQVFVSLPFPTYFAGVIGWNTMEVGADATGLARVGADGYRGGKWGVFALDGKGCSNPEVDLGATTGLLAGNAHSNGGFSLTGMTFDQSVQARIDWVTAYTDGNRGYFNAQVSPKSVVLPTFQAYYNLAYSQGVQYTANTIVAPYPNPVYVVNGAQPGGNNFGSDGADGVTRPYTFINGDLLVTRTNNTAINLGGLIVVNGDVYIAAPNVNYQSRGYSILATGRIFVTSTARFQVLAYQDTNNLWDPLVSANVFTAALWSNKDGSDGGADPCTAPVISLTGNRFAILGAVMAPNGQVNLNNTGQAKSVSGTIIADTIFVRGNNMTIAYQAAFFPPQPDFVELME